MSHEPGVMVTNTPPARTRGGEALLLAAAGFGLVNWFGSVGSVGGGPVRSGAMLGLGVALVSSTSMSSVNTHRHDVHTDGRTDGREGI